MKNHSWSFALSLTIFQVQQPSSTPATYSLHRKPLGSSPPPYNTVNISKLSCRYHFQSILSSVYLYNTSFKSVKHSFLLLLVYRSSARLAYAKWVWSVLDLAIW